MEKEKSIEISLLNLIRMLARSRQDVSQNTTKNYFKHVGLPSRNYTFDEENNLPLAQRIINEEGKDDEDNQQEPLTEKKRDINLNDIFPNLYSYNIIDNGVKTADIPSDIDSVQETVPISISYCDHVKSTKTLVTYLEQDENVTKFSTPL